MRKLAALAGAALVAAVAALSAGAAESGPTLSESVARFPDRYYLLTLPAAKRLATGDVRVTENGVPVSGLAVTRPGDEGFVTMLVIDASNSMRGKPIADAMKAARAFAARRNPSSPLGVVFFNDMNIFLKRITILETRLPKYKAYQNCLMEVFSSFLSLCGVAQKYIELKRFKKWITNLFKGEDGDLSGARAQMVERLGHLQQATEFATLANTEETLEMTAQLEENQEAHQKMLKEVGETIENIESNTMDIKNDVSKLLKLFNAQKKQPTQEKPQAKKPPSARGIRHAMPYVINEDHEWKTLTETMVPDTCQWIFSEPGWVEWAAMKDGTRPPFGISAQPGAGKSHMAATIHEKLRAMAREDETHNTCVGHFYFREREDNWAWFLCAIITSINQAAEQNSTVCEKFSAQIARDDLEWKTSIWQDLATHLLGFVFGESSKYSLLMLLDGIDELKDGAAFSEFLTKFIMEKKLRISVAFTTRPETLKDLPEECGAIIVEATKAKQLADLKTIIWHRINSLDNLKTYSRFVQQKLAVGVEEASPSKFALSPVLTLRTDHENSRSSFR